VGPGAETNGDAQLVVVGGMLGGIGGDPNAVNRDGGRPARAVVEGGVSGLLHVDLDGRHSGGVAPI
jgi:hypothetical protein